MEYLNGARPGPEPEMLSSETLALFVTLVRQSLRIFILHSKGAGPCPEPRWKVLSSGTLALVVTLASAILFGIDVDSAVGLAELVSIGVGSSFGLVGERVGIGVDGKGKGGITANGVGLSVGLVVGDVGENGVVIFRACLICLGCCRRKKR